MKDEYSEGPMAFSKLSKRSRSSVEVEAEDVSERSATAAEEVKSSDEGVKAGEAEIADNAEPAAPTSPTSGRATLRSLWPSRIIVRGTPSGETYIFERAGAEVAVAGEDVEHLLSKNQHSGTRGCCGGSGDRVLFEKA